MAARGSASSGMIVLASVLGVSTIALFITTVVFFAKAQSATDAKNQALALSSEILSDQDRNNPLLQRYKEQGKRERPPKTAVGYLLSQQEALMRRVSGAPNDTLETVYKTLAIDPEKNTSTLVSMIRDRDADIAAMKTKLEQAEAARQRALVDQQNEAARIKELEEAQNKTVASLKEDVGTTQKEADKLQADVNAFKSDMDARVGKIKEGYASKETSLQGEIDKLQRDRALDQARIATFDQKTKATRFKGAPEASLVDGSVVGFNPADGTVVLSIGRAQKVVLGLTFEVYTEATAIRPDAKTGNYPRGKASVEVIRVDNDSSIARVIHEQRGATIVPGDVVANAVYDPSKTYKFVVYGNFDPNHTGDATSIGANQIKARIKAWGGQVVDSLSGDVDFVVLGERPSLPPQPASNAPKEVVQEYVRLQQAANKYDQLFNQATATSIPVLNENRLYTLTGER